MNLEPKLTHQLGKAYIWVYLIRLTSYKFTSLAYFRSYERIFILKAHKPAKRPKSVGMQPNQISS